MGAASAGAATFAGAVELMQRDIPWEGVGERVRQPRPAAVARGLALGLPLLLVFGALFVAADAVFKSYLLAAVAGCEHRVAARRDRVRRSAGSRPGCCATCWRRARRSACSPPRSPPSAGRPSASARRSSRWRSALVDAALPRVRRSSSCATSSAGSGLVESRCPPDLRAVRAARLLRAGGRGAARAAAAARRERAGPPTERGARLVRVFSARARRARARRDGVGAGADAALPARVRPDGAADLRDRA